MQEPLAEVNFITLYCYFVRFPCTESSHTKTTVIVEFWNCCTVCKRIYLQRIKPYQLARSLLLQEAPSFHFITLYCYIVQFPCTESSHTKTAVIVEFWKHTIPFRDKTQFFIFYRGRRTWGRTQFLSLKGIVCFQNSTMTVVFVWLDSVHGNRTK